MKTFDIFCELVACIDFQNSNKLKKTIFFRLNQLGIFTESKMILEGLTEYMISSVIHQNAYIPCSCFAVKVLQQSFRDT